MKTLKKQTLLLLILIAAVIAVRFSGIGDVVTLESVKRNRDMLLAFVKEQYALSVLIYIASYITVVAFSVPGATVMTLAGAYVYGALRAALYVNIAATTGAALVFLAVRYLLGTRVQQRYEAQLRTFNAEMEKNGARYLLTLRFLPVFPFFLVNILPALTNVPLRTFLWTTSLGIIPGTLIYAYAGEQLGTLQSLGQVLSTRILIAFVLLALFTCFPMIWKRLRGPAARKRGQPGT
jgi:uncharacterized membrane protein YdjX (TVP38/TMEM64 family)